MRVNRRAFVTASVSGAAVTATGAKSLQRPGPNDRIRVGCIGVGGMGRMNQSDFQRLPEVDVVAVCDVWDHNRKRKIEWDWKNERIIGDAEANRLLTKQYRSPWKV